MAKNIVLCADDYGINQLVNQAILQLIAEHRISATSCMVNFEDWLVAAKPLKDFINQVDIGLHFNLTEGEALTGFPSLINAHNQFFNINQLILRCFSRKITKQDIINELNAQLDQFEAAFQAVPNYIDGHQHIHHLPVIRDALFEVYQHRLRAHKVYIRSVRIPYSQIIRTREFKILIIQLTGAVKFAALLNQLNIPHNQSFAGFYDFNPQVEYRSQFNNFLTLVNDGGLIMCHPGLLNEKDKIGKARKNELQYFTSEYFLQDCQQHGINIARFL